MFLLKLLKLIIQKHQTSHILQYLRLFVLLQVFFSYQGRYGVGFGTAEVTADADGGCEVRLALFQEAAPV